MTTSDVDPEELVAARDEQRPHPVLAKPPKPVAAMTASERRTYVGAVAEKLSSHW